LGMLDTKLLWPSGLEGLLVEKAEGLEEPPAPESAYRSAPIAR